MTIVDQWTVRKIFGGFNHEAQVDVPQCGTIGDFVWHDLNHNGVQDPGEPGINGVTVNLSDAGGLLASYVTGPNPVGGVPGYYQFSNVCEGTYFVDVDESSPALAGFTPTLKDVGDDTTDSDSEGGAVTVVAPAGVFSNQTIDFGFETPCDGSIGNRVARLEPQRRAGRRRAWYRWRRAAIERRSDHDYGRGGKYLFTGLCAGATPSPC